MDKVQINCLKRRITPLSNKFALDYLFVSPFLAFQEAPFKLSFSIRQELLRYIVFSSLHIIRSLCTQGLLKFRRQKSHREIYLLNKEAVSLAG
jgi:hypothetical protein